MRRDTCCRDVDREGEESDRSDLGGILCRSAFFEPISAKTWGLHADGHEGTIMRRWTTGIPVISRIFPSFTVILVPIPLSRCLVTITGGNLVMKALIIIISQAKNSYLLSVGYALYCLD